MARQVNKLELEAGYLFAVPLPDGTQTCFHVAFVDKSGRRIESVTVGFFPERWDTLENAMNNAGTLDRSMPAFAFTVVPNAMLAEGWVKIGERPSNYENINIPARLILGQLDGSCGTRSDIFPHAWYGFLAWDALGDPAYFEKRLLSPHLRPETAIFSKVPADVAVRTGNSEKRSAGAAEVDDADQVALAELVKRGDDLSRKRAVCHYINQKTTSAGGYQSELAAFGEVVVEGRRSEIRQVVPGKEIIRTASKLRALAARYGLEYEGWESAVTKT